ncbi:MAG: AbrB/MazE/SpoVT family DNA-binding domain-containing protein [Thermoplasmata archaeon]|nr:AbrB/MazE/SpoVT family DNA-binding domain-containing protein [Thermoplasmata archaeon]
MVTMEIVRLSSKGQVVIPVEIRNELELKQGDKMIVQRKDDRVVLRPVAKLSRMKGIDRKAWKDTSREIGKMRKEWDERLK